MLQKQIAITDKQIDQLVYHLYDLTHLRFISENGGEHDIEKLADTLGVHFTTVYRDLEAISKRKSNKVN